METPNPKQPKIQTPEIQKPPNQKPHKSKTSKIKNPQNISLPTFLVVVSCVWWIRALIDFTCSVQSNVSILSYDVVLSGVDTCWSHIPWSFGRVRRTDCTIELSLDVFGRVKWSTRPLRRTEQMGGSTKDSTHRYSAWSWAHSSWWLTLRKTLLQQMLGYWGFASISCICVWFIRTFNEHLTFFESWVNGKKCSGFLSSFKLYCLPLA